jgi:lipopolysaccharide/colanic/teichoic acid biosynthesis glycosyltransferase
VILPFVLLPLAVLLMIAAFSTRNNGLFVQKRVGYLGETFDLYKIRSLKGNKHRDIVDIKNSETSFGRWLRKSKLDEIPQIFNVLKGDMSWVGPRPDIPGYADKLKGEDRVILEVKPGITGPATLKYRNEDALLLKQEHPLEYNDTVIWPDKVKINIKYVQDWSLWMDVNYLWRSIVGGEE